MKKYGILALVVILLLGSVGVGLFVAFGQKETKTAKESEGVRTFADWTDYEALETVPALIAEGTQIDDAKVAGGGYFSISVNGTSLENYQHYLELLEENGFKKYYDNGEKGLNNNTYTSTYTKEDLVVTVVHLVKPYKTYIIASEDAPLTDRLFYKDEYVAGNKAGAKTTMAMLELYDRGNAFVIQMKNGNFIVCDGGHNKDLDYLLSYMEERVPEGQKPIVEAWMLTHPHDDHMEFLQELTTDATQAARVYVENLFFSQLPAEMAASSQTTRYCGFADTAAKVLKTSDGGHPEIYRPQAGQRYYFSDITVDVLLTMEQVPEENWHMYTTNINETSSWMLFTIDGQTFLHGGDGEYGSVKAIMRTYDQNLLELDIMSTLHHSIAVYDDFTDFCKVKTMLYTHYGTDGVFRHDVKWTADWQANTPENQYLQTQVQEYMHYGDGTKVLTFPYVVGTAESLPLRGERLPRTQEYFIPY